MIQTQGQTFAGLVNNLVAFIDASVVPLLFLIAFIVFLIGVVRYFFSESDEKRTQGRQFVVWGGLGLVVMFCLWGIVNLFLRAFTS